MIADSFDGSTRIPETGDMGIREGPRTDLKELRSDRLNLVRPEAGQSYGRPLWSVLNSKEAPQVLAYLLVQDILIRELPEVYGRAAWPPRRADSISSR